MGFTPAFYHPIAIQLPQDCRLCAIRSLFCQIPAFQQCIHTPALRLVNNKYIWNNIRKWAQRGACSPWQEGNVINQIIDNSVHVQTGRFQIPLSVLIKVLSTEYSSLAVEPHPWGRNSFSMNRINFVNEESFHDKLSMASSAFLP